MMGASMALGSKGVYFDRNGKSYNLQTEKYTPISKQLYIGNPTNSSRKYPVLCNSREECCGCSVCSQICPTSSIHMIYDTEGFLYPVIDVSSCIACNRCVVACVFKKRTDSS